MQYSRKTYNKKKYTPYYSKSNEAHYYAFLYIKGYLKEVDNTDKE